MTGTAGIAAVVNRMKAVMPWFIQHGCLYMFFPVLFVLNAHAFDGNAASPHYLNILKVIGEVGDDLIISFLRLKALQQHFRFAVVHHSQVEDRCDAENLCLYSLVAVLDLNV